MITGFQKYLINKGFKRYYCNFNNKKNIMIENYESLFLSSYDILTYEFIKDNKYCYFGLSEYQKPPVMFLGNDKILIIQNKKNYRTNEDGYRILFSQWKENEFEKIYQTFMSNDKYFLINCENEEKIFIEIKCK